MRCREPQRTDGGESAGRRVAQRPVNATLERRGVASCLVEHRVGHRNVFRLAGMRPAGQSDFGTSQTELLNCATRHEGQGLQRLGG